MPKAAKAKKAQATKKAPRKGKAVAQRPLMMKIPAHKPQLRPILSIQEEEESSSSSDDSISIHTANEDNVNGSGDDGSGDGEEEDEEEEDMPVQQDEVAPLAKKKKDNKKSIFFLL